MKTTLKVLVASGLVAATIAVAAPAASATSMSTVQGMTGTISDDMTAMGEAGRDFDVSGMEDACSDLEGHTAVAMSFSRPKGMPKQAWKHTKLAFGLMNRAASACEQGAADYDADLIAESTDLLDEATIEVEIATSYMS